MNSYERSEIVEQIRKEKREMQSGAASAMVILVVATMVVVGMLGGIGIVLWNVGVFFAGLLGLL
jgi:hypothetical protein